MDLTDTADVSCEPAQEAPAQAVDVLVDGSGPLGALSYLVPDGMRLRPGDAVSVPLGARQAHGLVLGDGHLGRATRPVLRRWGTRTRPAEIEVAAALAARHFVPLHKVACRLSPTSGRDADPAVEGSVQLREGGDVPSGLLCDVAGGGLLRRFVARPPTCDPASFAAAVAEQLQRSADGRAVVPDGGGVQADGKQVQGKQVLVLCPTVKLVEQVLACFDSGARRVDASADPAGWAGFVAGSVPVAVGTRACALYSAPNLAGVVVVEAEHPGHLEQRAPHTHTRDVALLRSALAGLDVVLCGALPTPPALTSQVTLSCPTVPGGWPEVEVVDRSSRSGTSWLMPPQALTLARARRDGEVDQLALTERREAIWRCVRCSSRRVCPNRCGSAVTCDHQLPVCARCGERQAKVVGFDRARLRSILPRQVKPVDLQTLRARASRTSRPAQVFLLFADAPWHRVSLTPESEVAGQVLLAAEAAGPDGQVVAVTSRPHEPVWAGLAAGDVRSVATVLWRQARDFALPPFTTMVRLSGPVTGSGRVPPLDGLPGRVLGPDVHDGRWERVVVVAPEQEGRVGKVLAALPDAQRRKIKVTVT